jgi:hypothetical protein
MGAILSCAVPRKTRRCGTVWLGHRRTARSAMIAVIIFVRFVKIIPRQNSTRTFGSVTAAES